MKFLLEITKKDLGFWIMSWGIVFYVRPSSLKQKSRVSPSAPAAMEMS